MQKILLATLVTLAAAIAGAPSAFADPVNGAAMARGTGVTSLMEPAQYYYYRVVPRRRYCSRVWVCRGYPPYRTCRWRTICR